MNASRSLPVPPPACEGESSIFARPEPDFRPADLGEPFATRAALLAAWGHARDRRRRAEVGGPRAEIAAAELAEIEARADLERHADHLADSLLMHLRFAAERRPHALAAVLG